MSQSRSDDDSTGLPIVDTWPRVYLLVVLVFIVCVVALVILERMYS
jgi:hypothetical protein